MAVTRLLSLRSELQMELPTSLDFTQKTFQFWASILYSDIDHFGFRWNFLAV